MEEQRRFFHIMKTLWVSAGDGATQATGPADEMGETGRTPALGLVTRAPLSFTVKLCPDTCCHGDALHCKRLSGPRGLKTAHASPRAQSTKTHGTGSLQTTCINVPPCRSHTLTRCSECIYNQKCIHQHTCSTGGVVSFNWVFRPP